MTFAQHLKMLHARLNLAEKGEVPKNRDAELLKTLMEDISIKRYAENEEKFISSQGFLNITLLEKELQLEFLEEETQEGEVCFAQSSELRDDFKTWFTALDLLDFIYASLYPRGAGTNSENPDFTSITYPENQDKFWLLVGKGKELRNAVLKNL